MRAFGRRTVIVGIALAVAIGVLYLAVPANETADEGPADPILSLRRPVIRFLIWAGIVEGPGFFGGHPYLPTVGGSESWEPQGDPDDERIPATKTEIEIEPVYRGLLWPVGDRITYRMRLFGDYRESWRAVRLCYAQGDRESVAGENRSPDPGGQLAEVSGFVPRSARGYWIEYTDDKGEVRSGDGWGDTHPFFRD